MLISLTLRALIPDEPLRREIDESLLALGCLRIPVATALAPYELCAYRLALTSFELARMCEWSSALMLMSWLWLEFYLSCWLFLYWLMLVVDWHFAPVGTGASLPRTDGFWWESFFWSKEELFCLGFKCAIGLLSFTNAKLFLWSSSTRTVFYLVLFGCIGGLSDRYAF